MQQSNDLKLAISAVKKAGEIIQKGYGQTLQITSKGNHLNIVTQIDRESEEIIMSTLQADSDYPILAEESGQIGQIKDTFWVTDPLDGTTNFSRGIPFFSVSVAQVKKNQVILGVTLNPLTGELYSAQKGQGSNLNDKPIRVSSKSESAMLILNQGYSNEATVKYIQSTQKLSPAFTVRRLGSSCLEHCLVASGVVEGSVSFGDKLWDYAAGVLLVEEAGGKVTDWKGNRWTFDNHYVLASNGLIHEKIKESIDSLQTTG